LSVSAESWRRLWTELGAAEVPAGLFNQLVAAYSETHRRDHTLQHLRECLAYFDSAASLARRPAEVELALWFHDAVHDPRAADNEERSADWAQRSVRAAGCDDAVGERVRALVLATARHEAHGDPDAEVLLDVDLAILGATPARYADYARQVRAEFAHLDEAEFRGRRAAILENFLARTHIYATAAFHDALEQRARVNLTGELAALRA